MQALLSKYGHWDSHATKDPFVRRGLRGDLLFVDSPSMSGAVMCIESDFDTGLLACTATTPGLTPRPLSVRPLPMRPFLVSATVGSELRVGTAGSAVLSKPGEVGGRAIGTELMECALRLWVCEAERGVVASGVRVFVNVIVTEKGSPAK